MRTSIIALVFAMSGLALPSAGVGQRSLGDGLEPDWSPDGGWIMVSVLVDEQQRELMLVSPDGERRRVTDSAESELLAKWSTKGEVSYILAAGSGLQLHVMSDPRAGGTTSRRLDTGDLTLAFLAAPWTPDGSALTVVAGDYPETDIYRVPVDGGPITPLVSETGYDGTPAFSADGRLAFASDRNGTRDIWLREPDGTEHRLTTGDGREDHPAWSPDGRWLAYQARRGHRQEIHIIGVESGRIIRVTEDGATNGYPAWSPDGASLAYVRVSEGRANDQLIIAPVPDAARGTEP